MHPIERLRYVARSYGVPPAELALEAAEALGSLAGEPRALVPACRRLLDAQPHNAPLWWVAAHVLAAADPGAAAAWCARQLAGDLTALELAYSVPSGAAVAVEAAASVLAALDERPDGDLRIVGAPGDVRLAVSQLSGGVAGGPAVRGYGDDEVDEALEGAAIALVEAAAASPTRLLLRPTGAELAAAAGRHGASCWVAAGTGTVLPEALFERCCEGAEGVLVEAVGTADTVAGPGGLRNPAEGLDPGDCPVPGTLVPPGRPTRPGRPGRPGRRGE